MDNLARNFLTSGGGVRIATEERKALLPQKDSVVFDQGKILNFENLAIRQRNRTIWMMATKRGSSFEIDAT
jgi:hypothetical protein